MPRIRPFLPLFLSLAGIFTVLLILSGSWLIARKVVALLILPAGLLWLILFAAIFWKGISKGKRCLFAAVWLLYSVAGSPYAGIALLRPLEEPYFSSEILEENLDAMVLLGGGTLRSPGGNPAVGAHGDRVLRPAIWYHQGKVKTLITTGRSVTEIGADRILSRETSLLWQKMGIPSEAIVEIPEPRNTSEELAAVADFLKEHPEWERVGLCSSASHLNRALGEARKQGLDLIPVPSDFRSMPLRATPLYIVPQARGFRDVQTALWEYLGRCFGK